MYIKNKTIADLNELVKDTLISYLGIEFTEIDGQVLKAKMPVPTLHLQPDGIIHGGALLAFAETIGSAASLLVIDLDKKNVRGFDISANHVKSVKGGEGVYVFAQANPIHLGRTTQIWQIHITNDLGQLVSLCKVTNIIIDKK